MEINNAAKMKRIYTILTVSVLALLASCQEPVFIEPTVEGHQDIISLTAYFTKGKYVEKEAGKLKVAEGENPDRYVIPIYYYYPEKSDDETTLHLNRMRVRAELAPNCKIEPSLTVLDLMQENKFTYTDAKGESKEIIITGERVPFKTAQFLSFDLVDAPENGRTVVTGFVDNVDKIIYLFTIDDLSNLYLKAKPWYHGSIKDYKELSEKPGDWNTDRIVTAIAHDGETMQDYQVLKREPSKIRYGFNTPKLNEEDLGYWGMFSIDPYVELGSYGVPHYDDAVSATLAYVDGYLVLNHIDIPGDGYGDGKTYEPIYLDAMDGSYKGKVNVGTMTNVGAVTNDEGGNLLLCNWLDEENKGTFEIYRTRKVEDAPTLFYSFESTVGYQIGSKIKVCGNIDTDAVIVAPYDGVDGAESGSFLNIIVKNGAVESAEVIDMLSAEGVQWGLAPMSNAGVVAANSAGDNGWFYGQHHYAGIDGLRWIRPDLKLGKTLESNLGNNAWLIRAGCLDTKNFNGATYMAHLALHYFPAWEEHPSLWVYDIADPATVTGTYQESSAIVAYDSWITQYNNASAYQDTRSCGDVVMAESADGLRLFIYCYDHYANLLCGYAADCVKRK